MPMARFLFLVVRLLLLCLGLSGCWALWRYRTRVENYILFSARTTIYLEYEGTSFVEWEVSILCSVENKGSPRTTLSCPVPGTHKIMPVVRNPTFKDKERYLTINADLNCFLWYTYSSLARRSSSEQSSQVLIIWIYDPENAEGSEVNNTATVPPAHSRALSKQFVNLGQSPFIKTYVEGTEYADTEFTDEGFWRLEIPSSTDDIIGYIHGKAVTFQGCFVAGSPFVIATSEMPLVDIHEISISSPAGSDSKLIRSACFPATAVLLTDYGAFLTVDGFKTSKEIKFPSTVLDAALAHSVKAVALSYSRITFLINDVLYIMKNGVFYKAEDSQFPRRGVQGVVSRIWCESEYPGDNFVLSDLLFWTEKEIYYQFPSSDTEDLTYMFMDTELLKRVMGFSDSANLIIINACYDSVPSEISILIACTGCSSSRKFYLVAYDEDSSVWLLRDFSLPAPPGAFFHMGVLYSAVSSMLLWDKDKVYYSYNKNKVNGYITVSDTHEILSASSERTTIHQVIIDSDGNTVIKMKNNAMFFLKFNMKDVIRLNDWEDENTKYILYLNPHHDLYFLTVNGSDIDREIYPLKIEVFSATYILNEVCPYISFQHSMELNIYYLDKGDNVTFWTQIVFLENLGLSTDIKTYRSDLLKRKTELQYEIARGICTKNETVTFYEDHDYSKDLNYNEALISSSGVFVVEMKPSTTGRRCITNQKLSFIKIGCSPFRHVGILTPSSCDYHNFTFKIPTKYQWMKTNESEVEIKYNKEKFGCPIQALYTEPFRPVAILYENDEAISIVHSDYMLWEVNGREDFHYNSTMEQARCLQEAQNKALMIPESTENISRLEELWGPQNYKPCFVSEEEYSGDLHKPYEIMNHSGINSIIWPQRYSGIFMFRLIILDPNYSFCDFKVYFAVHTYGIIERPNMLKIAAWSILIVTCFFGVLIFSYFRYTKIFRSLSFVDPLLSLHARTSSKEAKKEV